MSKTLYERIGGEPAVDAAVTIFYRKVLADQIVSNFLNIRTWTNKSPSKKAFFTMTFGGPNSYAGQDMRNAHAGMVRTGLNEDHFNAVMEHLSSTLTE